MKKCSKDKIAEVSFQLFIKNGYSSTTLREIAKECNITHANILYHFKGKNEIADTFIMKYLTSLHNEINKMSGNNAIRPSMFKASLYWTTHFCFMTAYPDFRRAYLEMLFDDREIIYRNISKSELLTSFKLINTEISPDFSGSSFNTSLNFTLLTEADYQILKALQNNTASLNQGLEYMIDLQSRLETGKPVSKVVLHQTISVMLDMVSDENLKLIGDAFNI